MTLAQTYSWLFYALALASRTQPAKYQGIEQVADGINHAIPTQKEFRGSMSWLISEGLALKEGKSYCLTEKGEALLSESTNNVNTTSGVWAKLEKIIEDYGVDNVIGINPNTLNT